MTNAGPTRRDILQTFATLPLGALLRGPREAAAQTAGAPGKVETKGLTAKIKFESVLSGYLGELNGKNKLRVTELVLEPGGYVGEHHHAGPGIRQVTSGHRTGALVGIAGVARATRRGRAGRGDSQCCGAVAGHDRRPPRVGDPCQGVPGDAPLCRAM